MLELGLNFRCLSVAEDRFRSKRLRAAWNWSTFSNSSMALTNNCPIR